MDVARRHRGDTLLQRELRQHVIASDVVKAPVVPELHRHVLPAEGLDQARQFAVERFAQELLPAMDGFELALANQGADLAAVLEGQGATLRLLQKAFEKAGIKELAPAAGTPFNPEEHEAMVAQPTADVPAGAVLTTIQKGYSLNGRVLRAARVIVARALDA